MLSKKVIGLILKIKKIFLSNSGKIIVGFILLTIYYFSLPRNLFNDSYATVVESSNGQFLGAKIAKDGQWRFPESDSVPYKFQKCIVAFEDQYFYKHIGFNPVAMLHAFQQNRAAGKVVRGGSTLTQQVIRLHRKNAERSYFEKLLEVILATRLEFRYTKDEVLNLYASHAPFGGNVVGLEMASWRYFGLQPHQLSWAEAATLAVLPNAPRLIYPGKNQEILLQKRNRLLKKLWQQNTIDKETYDLALLEPLPQKPYAIPKIASHLTEKINTEKQGQKITTTIDHTLQERVNEIVAQYYNSFRQNKVYNMAVLVVDVKYRKVLSYVGNTPTDKEHQKDVDVIQAPRSTGSILKPFLYAAMLDEGELLPNTLVPDIPTQISGYSPQNYNYTFDGAVPATRALARSLNIPAVLMLKEYSVNRLYEKLQKLKQHSINRHPSHYGLSLILGGAESSLWDLCEAYAYMASTLNHFTAKQDLYRSKEMTLLRYITDEPIDFGIEKSEKNIYGAGAIWQTFNAMKEVNRPEGDEAWRFYDSSLEIAWKTGTSFGGRDAWAIGVNPDYVVGVWVGNATGEGRPLLTGVESAAPVLFDVFRTLPKGKWFAQPFNDMEKVMVCEQSGYLAQENCPIVEQWIPKTSKKTETCPYHKIIHLDKNLQFTVNSSCESIDNMVSKSWFILPPVMEWYYKSKHVDYVPVPPLREDCKDANAKPRMAFIYPNEFTKIILTKDFNGIEQPVILKVAYSNPEAELFWYVDDQFLGTTKTFHEQSLITTNGQHLITVVDEDGNEIKQRVSVERSR